MTARPFYAADLAHVHDAGFGDFARNAAPGLLRMLRGAGIRDGLVVDLGCGSGIWAAALTRAGYDVLGIDVSADLLAIARHRAPGAELVHGSIHEVDLPDCVAVTALGEIFNYAHDPRAGRAGTTALLVRIHAALAPGGMLVFDVAAPGREPRPRRDWHESSDWTLCLEAAEDPAARTLTRRIAVFHRDGDGYRRSDELHTLHLYDRTEILADLHATGFEARSRAGYGRAVRFRRGWAAFAALKPRDDDARRTAAVRAETAR